MQFNWTLFDQMVSVKMIGIELSCVEWFWIKPK